jgi:hypothetical protein
VSSSCPLDPRARRAYRDRVSIGGINRRRVGYSLQLIQNKSTIGTFPLPEAIAKELETSSLEVEWASTTVIASETIQVPKSDSDD